MQEITKDSFTPIPKNIESSQQLLRPSLTYWQDAWRRLKLNKVAMVSMYFLIVIVLIAFIGPIIFPDFKTQDLLNTFAPPSAEHWFGTDELGRDVFARVLRGSRVSLTIGITVSAINVVIGVLYGGISGYIGGVVDDIMMRIIDVLITIPELIIMILLLTVMQPGVGTLILAMSITGWTSMARLMRGQVLQIRESEYVLASRVLGAGKFWIIVKHLIPNALGPIIVRLTMSIPSIIFTEAFLSYIGLGIRVPEASWGNLAEAGAAQFPNYLWMFFIPAVLICLTMLAFNMFGDGLRDALDPKMRK
ncbi:MAG: ABC transporter permease [Oscillospiraceae bacterium]|nr:ABC transporter permease [Oscillospiraceae bacterium]